MSLILSPTTTNIEIAAKALKNGSLVGIPTETVYGLAADAENQSAVKRIFEVKNRPYFNPLIIHIGAIEYVDFWASEFSEEAMRIAKKLWPGPLTLVLKRSKNTKDLVTASQDSVALRIPNHDVTLKLLENFHLMGGKGLAAPSANKYQEISPTKATHVSKNLGSKLQEGKDYIIDGGQSKIGIESTIISFLQDKPILLRPGFISRKKLESLGIQFTEPNKKSIEYPGKDKRHYVPKVKIFINEKPESGQGFYAMNETITPEKVIRIGSPSTIEEFISGLYAALIECDKLKLQETVISIPENNEHREALVDRISKMIFAE